MKIYKIKVNGKAYEVELESVTEKEGSVELPKEAAPKSLSAGGEKVAAPMAGKILDIKVKVGQKIAKGDVIVILEAMKLENEIRSQSAGIVKEIAVSKDAMVNNGDALIILE